ncbi:MAG: hypothetical protein ACYDBH_10125, partial [Acidobacteriaceae bacterium]
RSSPTFSYKPSICSASRLNPSSADHPWRKFTSNHVCDVRNVSRVSTLSVHYQAGSHMLHKQYG